LGGMGKDFKKKAEEDMDIFFRHERWSSYSP
jgi:hypothetical protein